MSSLLSSAALSACSTFGIRGGYEQPPYRVVARIDDVEVRGYGPRLAAEVTVEDRGDARAARSKAFRRLAAYIFGGNRGKVDGAMTSPVAIERGPERIAMTSPVEAAAARGELTMRFFLPARLTLDTAPQPNDPDVRLRVVPAETMAVLRYRGFADDTGARRADLLRALDGSPWRPTGAAAAMFYDPPWTIPLLRRNEVAVPVAPR